MPGGGMPHRNSKPQSNSTHVSLQTQTYKSPQVRTLVLGMMRVHSDFFRTEPVRVDE